jgi:hypothetical protein
VKFVDLLGADGQLTALGQTFTSTCLTIRRVRSEHDDVEKPYFKIGGGKSLMGRRPVPARYP